MALFTVLHAVLPYCVQRQKSGKWLCLNREYKPVGFNTTGWITYGEHPLEMEIPGLTEKVAKRIAYDNEFDGEQIFLYNDGCVPTHTAEDMNNYLARLAILAQLDINPVKD